VRAGSARLGDGFGLGFGLGKGSGSATGSATAPATARPPARARPASARARRHRLGLGHGAAPASGSTATGSGSTGHGRARTGSAPARGSGPGPARRRRARRPATWRTRCRAARRVRVEFRVEPHEDVVRGREVAGRGPPTRRVGGRPAGTGTRRRQILGHCLHANLRHPVDPGSSHGASRRRSVTASRPWAKLRRGGRGAGRTATDPTRPADRPRCTPGVACRERLPGPPSPRPPARRGRPPGGRRAGGRGVQRAPATRPARTPTALRRPAGAGSTAPGRAARAAAGDRDAARRRGAAATRVPGGPAGPRPFLTGPTRPRGARRRAVPRPCPPRRAAPERRVLTRLAVRAPPARTSARPRTHTRARDDGDVRPSSAQTAGGDPAERAPAT
jgi:hypothetical protein